MTDNEIIKALEDKANAHCTVCEFKTPSCDWCMFSYVKCAIHFIKRQKAEIEALIAGQETLQKYIVTAKSEAIKEFAERLKEPFEIYWDAEEADALHMVGMIDCLVKEMVGDGEQAEKGR